MNFSEFRKQNAEKAPVEPKNSEPAGSAADTKNPEVEKEHQNKVLLKMKGDKTWIPRGPNIKTPGLTTENSKVHHKVKIHFGDHSEVRLVDDDELGVIRRSKHVTKVTQLSSVKEGKEYELTEEQAPSVVFQHKDGRKAYIDAHKYSDPSLGTDHYVHIDKSRATVFDNETKAHKLLKKLGFSKVAA